MQTFNEMNFFKFSKKISLFIKKLEKKIGICISYPLVNSPYKLSPEFQSFLTFLDLHVSIIGRC